MLNPIRIFSGSFRGSTLWKNPEYVSKRVRKREEKDKDARKKKRRKKQKVELRKKKQDFKITEKDEIPW